MKEYTFLDTLSETDPFLHQLVQREKERQHRKLIMIPSESIAPLSVREALGSVFQNIYAEGYPREEMLGYSEEMLKDFAQNLSVFRRYGDRRFYKGVEYVDIVESLAIRRAAHCFTKPGLQEDSIYVNVQPLSGSAANLAIYSALLQDGETIMGLDLFQGGHLTHGSRFNQSGRRYNAVSYGVDPKTEKLDYEAVRSLALQYRPKMIIAGYTAYSWAPDWDRFRSIADEVGAYLLADISHTVGLAIAGVYPDPVGIADVTMFTTHKTFCGPRGAVIITTDKSIAAKIDKAVFPGFQGGPHVNKMAAMAVAFHIAQTETYKALQTKIVVNARALADAFREKGLRIVHGGTDTHIVLLDVSAIEKDGTTTAGDGRLRGRGRLRGVQNGEKLYGEVAARVLDAAGIVVNKNTIPGDTATSHAMGIRFGTTWLTQKGFGTEAMKQIAEIVHTLLINITPFSYWGVSGSRPKGKIPFNVLQQAKRDTAELASGASVEPDISRSGYPHFWGDEASERVFPLLFTVCGYDARSFLQEVCATNVRLLRKGESTETLSYSPNGELSARLTVLRLDEDHYGRQRYACRQEEGSPAFIDWLRALSDGDVFFDYQDIYRKVPGPVIVQEISSESDPFKNTASCQEEDRLHRFSPDFSLPYFIGRRALAEAGRHHGPPSAADNTEGTSAADGRNGGSKRTWDYRNPERNTLRKTVLNALHKEAGAKMVPFAGWEMPVWYSGVADEHSAVRESAGLFDVAHMGCFEARGEHASEFLQSVTTNDIEALSSGDSCYGFLLEPDGKIIDDLIIYRIEKERFFLVVNAANEEKDWNWLTSVNDRKVIIDFDDPAINVRAATDLINLKNPDAENKQLRDVALQGPNSEKILIACGCGEESTGPITTLKKGEIRQISLGGIPLFLSRTGYTGEPNGYELFVHPEVLPDLWRLLLEKGREYGIKPCGLACRDSTRIEAGLPLYGHELAGNLDISPQEAGFAGFVKYHKSFFIGRDRLLASELKSDRQIVRWIIDHKGVRKPNPGNPVVNKQGTVIGEVTSCSIDTEGDFIGMALIKRRYAVPGTEFGIFVTTNKTGEEKRKDQLRIGDKVLLPVNAVVTKRFRQKSGNDR